jgi:hypothetical protein
MQPLLNTGKPRPIPQPLFPQASASIFPFFDELEQPPTPGKHRRIPSSRSDLLEDHFQQPDLTLQRAAVATVLNEFDTVAPLLNLDQFSTQAIGPHRYPPSIGDPIRLCVIARQDRSVLKPTFHGTILVTDNRPNAIVTQGKGILQRLRESIALPGKG